MVFTIPELERVPMDMKGKFFTDTSTRGSASFSATELLKAVNKLHNDVPNPVTD